MTVYHVYGTHYGTSELPELVATVASMAEAKAVIAEPTELMELCCFDFYLISMEVGGVEFTAIA